MDKISKFRVEAPLTIEIKVQFDEDGDPIDTDFESFIDRPYEAVVGQKNLLEEIYWEKMPGEAEE